MIPSLPNTRIYCIFSLLACFLFLFTKASAQTEKSPYLQTFSPGGLLEYVSDNKGNEMQLGEICINDRVRSKYTGKMAMTTVSSCSSGYFQLFLETGSGMEGTDPVSMARLNALCQVLQDISGFINSPCTTTGQKVNIWVKKSLLSGGGVASPFFNVPYSTTASGIADNTIWLTVNSGVDAFKGVSAPLVTSGGGSIGSTFFHGSIAFNFTSSSNWHTNLATPPAAGEWDFYTVALHEMMHAMGFGSLMDYNGASVIGAAHQYFTRFDTHIQTPAGVSLITAPSASCGMYDWDINPALAPVTAVISPGGASVCPTGYGSGSDHTVCTHRLEYSGSWPVNIPIYTPECFEKGSSLSHFEDECYVPVGFPLGVAGPVTNNQYFVMCNLLGPGPYSATTNPGAMKRYPQPEERAALCDLGYSVNTTYGSVANLNYVNYGGSSCPGLQVVGFNDGVAPGGAFIYTTVATTPVNINPASASLLTNDHGVTGGSFKCLELVNGSGTLSVTSGTLSTPVTFTPSSTSFGVQLLRYIPVSSTGVEGNITYVFVFVGNAGCTSSSSCDLVPNGGFENTLPGSVGMYIPGVNCWQPYAESPDLFTRCTGSVFCFPTSGVGGESHPFSSVANDHYIGFVSGNVASMGGLHTEAAQVQLTSSLLNLQTYRVSFWARYLPSVSASLPTHILFATGPNVPMPAFSTMVASMPAALAPLVDFELSMPDTAWHYYTKNITYSGSAANTLVLMGAPWLNPTTGAYSADNGYWIGFDDISIMPLADVCTFYLPDVLDYSCGTLIDLDSTVNVPGGIFTWQKDSSGHSVVTHSTLFDPMLAYNAVAAIMPAGDTAIVPVCYEYTTPSGCKKTVCDEIKVIIKGIYGPSQVCEGTVITLSNAVAGGTWSSSDISKATVGLTSGIVSGIASGTVRVTYTFAPGCYIWKKILVNPTPTVTPTPVTVCLGSTIALTSTPAGGYFLTGSPLVSITGSGGVTGLSLGVSTITYIAPGSGCTAFPVVSVTTTPSAITPAPAVVCVGHTVSLTSASAGLWTSGDASIATIGSATGIVTGLSAGTVEITYGYGCNTTTILTVSPGIPLIVPASSTAICVGATVSLSHPIPGGSWSSSNTSIAMVSSTGIVTGVAIGTVDITYMIPGGCYKTKPVTVMSPPPMPTIVGVDTICEGASITLGATITNGTWSSGNGNATVTGGGPFDPTSVVTGVTAGTATISYTISGPCGSTSAVKVITVLPVNDCSLASGTVYVNANKLLIYPNPNKGTFTVKLQSTEMGEMNVAIFNVIGEKVRELKATTNKETKIKMNEAAGMYLINVSTSKGNYVTRVWVE